MRRAELARGAWILLIVYVLVGITPATHACSQVEGDSQSSSSAQSHAHHQSKDQQDSKLCECDNCDCVSFCQSPPPFMVPECFGIDRVVVSVNTPWHNRLHAPPDTDVVHPPPNQPIIH